ncbi:MAG: hypothetical protein WA990_04545 [Rubrobacteraceae bacterium]
MPGQTSDRHEVWGGDEQGRSLVTLSMAQRRLLEVSNYRAEDAGEKTSPGLRVPR